MSIPELEWSIRDAKEAAQIHDQMDAQNIPNNSGRYWDQVAVYSDELARRTKNTVHTRHARYRSGEEMARERFLDRE